MTFWNFVGDLGLGLATAAIVLFGWVVVLFVCTEIQALRKRRWQRRCDAMINAVDSLLLAKRLQEDREVADLDAAFYGPSAPGS